MLIKNIHILNKHLIIIQIRRKIQTFKMWISISRLVMFAKKEVLLCNVVDVFWMCNVHHLIDV